jgi:hypothetical protein
LKFLEARHWIFQHIEAVQHLHEHYAIGDVEQRAIPANYPTARIERENKEKLFDQKHFFWGGNFFQNFFNAFRTRKMSKWN